MAQSERKFHRTVIRVEILSEDPYDPEDLQQVHHDITEGDASGQWSVVSAEKIDAKTCAKALLSQGSDPDFFGLTKDGAEVDGSPYAP